MCDTIVHGHRRRVERGDSLGSGFRDHPLSFLESAFQAGEGFRINPIRNYLSGVSEMAIRKRIGNKGIRQFDARTSNRKVFLIRCRGIPLGSIAIFRFGTLEATPLLADR
jgi:hypothetical protein